MDPRLLALYTNELRHLRQSAGEFARENPKIAGRLQLDKDGKEETQDPYVERLLEGFAYLAARVHLKLDAEYPRFTQSLLETVYPHYLCPTPSMAVVRFDPEEDAGLAEGFAIPRGTEIKSLLSKNERTVCTFRTAHEVRLFPVRIAEARCFGRDTQELGLPEVFEQRGRRGLALNPRSAIRLRLQTTAGVPFQQVKLDALKVFLRGATEDDRPSRLYEQIFARSTALVVQSGTGSAKQQTILPPAQIRRVGFGEDEALLPPSPRSFEGYRVLREYFAFPQRFLFFELAGLAEAVKRCVGNTLDLIVVLSEQDARLEGRVDASCFELFCAPVINLFPKQLDRIPLTDRFAEFHVVPDRNRPLDFEVFEIDKVIGYGSGAGEPQTFRPFYRARDVDLDAGAFYTVNRVRRALTERERQYAGRIPYLGTDVYLSVVDGKSAPYSSNLRELGVHSLCTNRALPLMMALGVAKTDFTMDQGGPWSAIRCLSGPTRPVPSRAEAELSWRIISHLQLNYLSLCNKEDEGAVALRDMLRLYADDEDRAVQRQIEGLRGIRARPVLRRVETTGPIAFARGLEIVTELDEQPFESLGAFVFGAVLGHFFAKYVSINSFTETVLRTLQRGEVFRWKPQTGKRPAI